MIWFFLNLLLLAAIFLALFSFRFAPDSRFFRSTAYRIENIARALSEECNEKPRDERDEITKRYSETYGVEFFLFDSAGRQLAGREIALPAKISEEIAMPEPAFHRRDCLLHQISRRRDRRLEIL